MKLAVVAAVLAVPLLAACPKPRTSAATQPSPVAFDVAKSDPKAIAVVDAGLTALGGYENWDKLKELRFTATYSLDGEMKSQFAHSWDRWNGRANVRVTIMETTHGKEEDIQYLEVKQDLFDQDKQPWAAADGGELMREDARKRAKAAATQLASDLYQFALIYKIKDPGVILALDNAEIHIADESVVACKPSCSSVKVTFEAGVGTDTWFVYYNNESHLPEVIEQQKGAGRIGFLLGGWTDAGGLKWPGTMQNIGLKGELYTFSGIKVGDPDDNRYEVQVR